MRLSLFTVSAVILITAALVPVHANKVTTDPNKASSLLGAAGSVGIKSEDPLSQKITYSATGKRLHTVLEELAEQNGVEVQAGKNANDWQVRDLPLVVCVYDMPLGKLLRTIADTTHLALTSTIVQDAKRYRIWRDGRREKQLADYYAGKLEARLGKANLQWDAWSKFDETTDAELKQADPDSDPAELSAIPARHYAKVFAALPAGTKEQVFSGRTVRIKMKNAAGDLANALRSLAHDFWEMDRKTEEEGMSQSSDSEAEPIAPRGELTDNVINSMELTLSLSASGDGDEVLTGAFESPMGGRHPSGGLIPCELAAMVLELDQDSFAEPEPPETEYAPGLRKLDLDHCEGLGLDKKINIEKPKPDAVPMFSDIVSDISKASGWSIVCEDFQSHKECYVSVARDFYGRGNTLKDALNALQEFGPIEWRIDAGRKLIVGSEGAWWDDHTKLVPESLVSGLISKMNGDGVGVDDVAATVLFAEGQRDEWIFQHKDLGINYDLCERFEPFWKLYAGLSAGDKALAKSEDGLPLAGLDRQSVLNAFAQCKQAADEEGLEGNSEAMMSAAMLYPGIEERVEAWGTEHYPQLSDPWSDDDVASLDMDEVMAAMYENFPEIKSAMEVPTKPAEIMKLKMRLRKVTPDGDYAESADRRLPASLRPHQYVMTIEGDGVKMVAGGLGLNLPMFSEKRREQIAKEMLEKQKNASQAVKP